MQTSNQSQTQPTSNLVEEGTNAVKKTVKEIEQPIPSSEQNILEQIWDFLSRPVLPAYKGIHLTVGSILLAFIIFVFIWVLARFAAKVFEKFLAKYDLPNGLHSVLRRVAFYALLVIGFFISLTIAGVELTTLRNFLSVLLHSPLVVFSDGTLTFSSMLTGIIVITIAYFLSKYAARGVSRLLGRRQLPTGAEFAAGKIISYIVLLLGVMVALNFMGIKLDAILAASAVLLVGIGFGLQNIAQNFISGIILLLEQPVKKGDFIEVGDTYGFVEDIGLRAIHVRTRDGIKVIVPNSDLISSRVVNKRDSRHITRISVSVGVKYGSNTELVKELLLSALKDVPNIVENPEPEVFFQDFGDSSLDFILRVWINAPQEDQRVASKIRFTIDKLFRENKVEIPFPQRDLHFKSGVQKFKMIEEKQEEPEKDAKEQKAS